jgi:hypothetical protein
MTNELLRWNIEGTSVIMETDEDVSGWAPASRVGERIIHDATIRFEDALVHVRKAAQTALRIFHEGPEDSVEPDEVEIEFGVKFGTEAGAMIAKTSLEGQFTVRLKWLAKNSEAHAE